MTVVLSLHFLTLQGEKRSIFGQNPIFCRMTPPLKISSSNREFYFAYNPTTLRIRLSLGVNISKTY